MIKYIAVQAKTGVLPFTHICFELTFSQGTLDAKTGQVVHRGYVLRGYPVTISGNGAGGRAVTQGSFGVKEKHLVKIGYPHPAAQQQAVQLYPAAVKEMCSYFERKYNLKCII